jgi:hypothetical protein
MPGSHKTNVFFACHSWLESGIELGTSGVADEDWIPEMIPPDHDFLKLPLDTGLADVIARHRERIASRTDVRRFEPASLMREIVRQSQAMFDFLLASGFYAPLTRVETERLLSAADVELVNAAPAAG